MLSRELGIEIIGGFISAFAVSAVLKWKLNTDWLETIALGAVVFIFIAWLAHVLQAKTKKSDEAAKQESDEINVLSSNNVQIATRGSHISGKPLQKPPTQPSHHEVTTENQND